MAASGFHGLPAHAAQSAQGVQLVDARGVHHPRYSDSFATFNSIETPTLDTPGALPHETRHGHTFPATIAGDCRRIAGDRACIPGSYSRQKGL